MIIREDKLGGVNIRATIPYYQIPSLYKTVDGIKTLNQGDEYYNDNIPYDGVYIHFAKQIMEVSCRRIELYVVYRIIVNCVCLIVYLPL